MKINPNWSSGDSAIHQFWGFGTYDGLDYRLFGFQKYSDNSIYLGWEGDAGHGGDQRITLADTGIFVSGTWANHIITWDDAGDVEKYYVDNIEKGSRTSTLTTQTLLGSETIGNVYEGLGAGSTADAIFAELARWDRVITEDERASLQAGFSPLCLINGLKQFIPLMGRESPEPDYVAGKTYTLTGTPSHSEHPRIIYPGAPHVIEAPADIPSGPEDLFHSAIFDSSVFGRAA